MTTEKSDAAAKADGAAGDANVETVKDETVAAAASGSPKEGGEEISPLADESIKSKSKKDKVKKKWSFRSISFGKKDKQKPAKTEEPASPTAAAATAGAADVAATAANPEAAPTNGEAERPAEAEGATATATADAATTEVILGIPTILQFLF